MIPRPVGDQAQAVSNAARALACALEHNSNPWRSDPKAIDVNSLIPRVLEISLEGIPDQPERPRTIDPFSALVGAAMALGITEHTGSTGWILEDPKL